MMFTISLVPVVSLLPFARSALPPGSGEDVMYCPKYFCSRADPLLEGMAISGPRLMFRECYNPATKKVVEELWTNDFNPVPQKGWLVPEPCTDEEAQPVPYCPKDYCLRDTDFGDLQMVGPPPFHERKECYNAISKTRADEVWLGILPADDIPYDWVPAMDCQQLNVNTPVHHESTTTTVECPPGFCVRKKITDGASSLPSPSSTCALAQNDEAECHNPKTGDVLPVMVSSSISMSSSFSVAAPVETIEETCIGSTEECPMEVAEDEPEAVNTGKPEAVNTGVDFAVAAGGIATLAVFAALCVGQT